jgi:hypothetical protein
LEIKHHNDFILRIMTTLHHANVLFVLRYFSRLAPKMLVYSIIACRGLEYALFATKGLL